MPPFAPNSNTGEIDLYLQILLGSLGFLSIRCRDSQTGKGWIDGRPKILGYQTWQSFLSLF